MTKNLAYPAAEVRPEHVVFGSEAYDDPYRWFEEDNQRTLSWQGEQDDLASRFLQSLPEFLKFGAALSALGSAATVTVPKHAGGRWFRQHRPEGEDLDVVEVSDSPAGPGRRVIDLNAMRQDEPLQMQALVPSPDGKKAVFMWSAGGRESQNLRIIDVDDGTVLLEGVPQMRASFFAWLPDSSGVCYSAYDPTISMTEQRVYLHRLGNTAPKNAEPIEMRHPVAFAATAADGRHLVLYQDHLHPRPDYILDVASGGQWRPFLKDLSGSFRGDIVGNRFFAVTDDGAPRRRFVAIPLATPTDRKTWQEIVPASENMVASVTVAGERLVLLDLVDTYARLRVFAADGALEGEIPLPGRGVVNSFGGTYSMFNMLDCVSRGRDGDVVFLYNSPTQAPALYRANAKRRDIERLTRPAVELDAKVYDFAAKSADGAVVPYHVVARSDVDISKPHPAVIYGYGGFNVAFLPGWPGNDFAAWIKAGGVLILAHLRGGGELGSPWWENGRLAKKQNSFNDVYAIAEDAIRRGISSPRHLGVIGGSNGGVMAAVVAVQRPDLFRAAVPQVPITDVLARVRDPITMAASLDYGDPTDAEMSTVIRAWSPYQNVVDGVDYPAILIDSGLNDPRCPAWHGRKFAARLQRASVGQRPRLLRVRAGAGHGTVGAEAQRLQHAEVLAFLAHELDLPID